MRVVGACCVPNVSRSTGSWSVRDSAPPHCRWRWKAEASRKAPSCRHAIGICFVASTLRRRFLLWPCSCQAAVLLRILLRALLVVKPGCLVFHSEVTRLLEGGSMSLPGSSAAAAMDGDEESDPEELGRFAPEPPQEPGRWSSGGWWERWWVQPWSTGRWWWTSAYGWDFEPHPDGWHERPADVGLELCLLTAL